jgi:hypothetical protein
VNIQKLIFCGKSYLLGTPETSLRGRRTRNALKALTSNPSLMNIVSTILINLHNKMSKFLYTKYTLDEHIIVNEHKDNIEKEKL